MIFLIDSFLDFVADALLKHAASCISTHCGDPGSIRRSGGDSSRTTADQGAILAGIVATGATPWVR